jgi:serine O-acetyltransferase
MVINLNSIITYIKSDLFRYEAKLSLKVFVYHFLLNRIFKYCFWFRLCKSENIVISLISRLMHYRLSRKYGIQIPRNTNIGYGLYIAHHMCIIVNESAVIGNNCNLSQFTTIGSNEGQAAIIGDNCYIGPKVNLVENVHIGNNCTIGAGVVVTKNVCSGFTVAGVPASPISQKTSGRYILNKWPHLEN